MRFEKEYLSGTDYANNIAKCNTGKENGTDINTAIWFNMHCN